MSKATSADIGKLIRSLRKKQEVQLAGPANTGIRFIGELESGKETCHIGKILRVVSALGLGMHIYSPCDENPE